MKRCLLAIPILLLMLLSCASPAPSPTATQHAELTTTVTPLAPTATMAPISPVASTKLAATPAVGAAVGLIGVADIVDGDTIKVNLAGKAETIRIIGMDTPEIVDPRKVVQCFGREASAKAHDLLDGQQVKLVADPTQDNRDKYDRLLRYVEKADGTDFGLWMIGNGYANEYTYQIPYQRQAAYKAAQMSAREKSLGLWAPTTCNGDTEKAAQGAATPVAAVVVPALRGVPPLDKDNCPTDYPIKGNKSSNGKIYHMPGSSSYNVTDPEECFANASDAEAAGYRKALR